jgi:hypothetical protein
VECEERTFGWMLGACRHREAYHRRTAFVAFPMQNDVGRISEQEGRLGPLSVRGFALMA